VDNAHQGEQVKHARPKANHPPKVDHHKPKSNGRGHRDNGQQASADKARRHHVSGRRLRKRRPAR
jgi:hypothetical protein